MSLVCIASQIGSPGATTTSLLLASLWPTPRKQKLLIEADPSGGSIAARHELKARPDLTTFAKVLDEGLTPGRLWAHTQQLAGDFDAIISPAQGEYVSKVLLSSGYRMGLWLDDLEEIDVFADIGALETDSPSQSLLSSSTALLMVARPVPEQLASGAARMQELAKTVPKIAWVLIGDLPYSPREVEVAHGFPVAAVLADDRQSSLALEQTLSLDRIARGPLLQTAKTLVATLEVELSRGKWVPVPLSSERIAGGTQAPPERSAPTVDFGETTESLQTAIPEPQVGSALPVEVPREAKAAPTAGSKRYAVPFPEVEPVASANSGSRESVPNARLTSDVPDFPGGAPAKRPDGGFSDQRSVVRNKSVDPASPAKTETLDSIDLPAASRPANANKTLPQRGASASKSETVDNVGLPVAPQTPAGNPNAAPKLNSKLRYPQGAQPGGQAERPAQRPPHETSVPNPGPRDSDALESTPTQKVKRSAVVGESAVTEVIPTIGMPTGSNDIPPSALPPPAKHRPPPPLFVRESQIGVYDDDSLDDISSPDAALETDSVSEIGFAPDARPEIDSALDNGPVEGRPSALLDGKLSTSANPADQIPGYPPID